MFPKVQTLIQYTGEIIMLCLGLKFARYHHANNHVNDNTSEAYRVHQRWVWLIKPGFNRNPVGKNSH